jgi:hypothetical protein
LSKSICILVFAPKKEKPADFLVSAGSQSRLRLALDDLRRHFSRVMMMVVTAMGQANHFGLIYLTGTQVVKPESAVLIDGLLQLCG